MSDFLTALQFLTRIRLVRQDSVTPAAFGASVKYFPLVGAVIGALLAAFWHLTAHHLSIHTLAAALIVIEIALTGGLHCDGLMDSADGLLSGRPREQMLEIMKDSRVGAHGVVAFVLLILAKWSLFLDLLPSAPLTALFVMPILGRLAMVIAIVVFPYARPAGIGKAFADGAGLPALAVAAATALACVLPLGLAAILALAASVLFALAFGRGAARALGGLTGDIYGAVSELGEVVVLTVFLVIWDWSTYFW